MTQQANTNSGNDYHQLNSPIGKTPPPITVYVFLPAVQPATNVTTAVSIFTLSEVPKELGLYNCVDERTRQISEFICTIETFPGDIFDADTDMINTLSSNCPIYNKAKKNVCDLYFYYFKCLLLPFFL